jgi:sterol 3beta-glucosyltransferase
VDFLAAGEPPVCVSFGSMVRRDGERIGRAVLEALARTGQRGVVLMGWGSWRPERESDFICYLHEVPHDWLFPRCSLVVHHGGAGTTAAGLRSGKPNVVVPFAADQPFWARRVKALGAGPEPIPVRKLTVDSLAAALTRALTDESIRRRAEVVGEKIRAEDGTGEAVRLIEAWAGSFDRAAQRRV